jgi:hypothetical protein
VYTSAIVVTSPLGAPAQMLEHLISADLNPAVFMDIPEDFTPVEKASPSKIIDAQVKTADWLKDLGLDDSKSNDAAQTDTARAAFAALTTGSTPASVQLALTNIKAPAAVQHLVGMLTAYDWEFVNQAKNLRGYAVAKILDDCENPNPNIRLKALGLLGKVTEIGLFTEKIEVKKVDASTEELEERIRQRLAKYLPPVQEIETLEVKEIQANDLR